MNIFLPSLTILMILVIYFDLKSYTIPNWLNACVLLLYPVMVLMQPEAAVDWQSGLLAVSVVFVIGFIIFAMNWMGGGDIKLLIATAAWFGFEMKLMEYLIMVALFGGVLAVGIWLIRKAIPWTLGTRKDRPWPRIFRDNEPVPYGLAIAVAFLIFLWSGDIAGVKAL